MTIAVTYNGNGSTGGGVPVDGNAYGVGDTVTVLGNINALVKSGYAFVDWNTKADGTGTAYTGGATFTMPAANVTLYAQWRAPVLDIDGNGAYDALTDGLLTIRYLFGLTGTSMTNGAIGTNATRSDPTAIGTYLAGIQAPLDVDGNSHSDALTDGLLIIRYLFGLRDAALIQGAIAPDATRKTAADVEAYILSLMP